VKNTQKINAIFEFLENIAFFDFDSAKQEKKVVFASGYFFKKNLEIRKRIVGLLQVLIDKGIEVQLNTNCTKEEIAKEYGDFVKHIEGPSKFGLEKRIPIHFIQCGNDFYLIEFPHTEKTVVRLNMFLNINKIE
jgi:hypothetical protein